ncbi:MFS transporter [Salininema proteolyticum]|uniref:MFS transporter n=1 Tax=Salininema proteolyticum TaxID=1607685 RepID=A0ABV8U201_9ACTN
MAVSPAVAENPPATAPTAWIWAAAWPIAAVFMLANAATPLYTVWQAELGFTDGTLTAVFVAYMLGMALSLLVSGIASDRLGRKKVLVPALILALVADAAFAFAHSVTALIVARILAGIASGAVVSAGAAAVTDIAGPSRKRLGALVGAIGIAVGTGLGPLMGGVVSETLPGPTTGVFVIEAGLLATAMAVLIALPLRNQGGSTETKWVRVPRVPANARRSLLLAVAVVGPGLTTTSFVLSLEPSLLAEVLGTDNRIVGGAIAVIAFTAATVAQLTLKQVRVRVLLLISASSTVACMGVVAAAVQAQTVVLFVLAAILAGTAYGPGMLGGLALMNRDVPGARLAEANAALNISAYSVAGVLSLVVGFLSDAMGLSGAVAVFAALLMALAVMAGLSVQMHRAHPAMAD